MYEQHWQVRFSECDHNSTLSYKGLVNFFQDCSNLQSENNQAGLSNLREQNRAWILDFWQIVIKKRPHTFDNVKVATWPNGFRGFFGTRNFLLSSADDEVMAYANSCWVYLDSTTGRPTRISEEEMSKYPLEEPYPMEYLDRKIAIPEQLECVDSIQVAKHHIDVYEHMNNANYIELACDAMNSEKDITQICCQYKKQARLGDTIHIWRHIDTNNMTVALKDTDGSIYAVVRLDF